MTIFDSIRYPISDIPAAEELKALPRDLYLKWRATRPPYKPHQMASIFFAYPEQGRRESIRLRKLILEYDDLPRN